MSIEDPLKNINDLFYQVLAQRDEAAKSLYDLRCKIENMKLECDACEYLKALHRLALKVDLPADKGPDEIVDEAISLIHAYYPQLPR